MSMRSKTKFMEDYAQSFLDETHDKLVEKTAQQATAADLSGTIFRAQGREIIPNFGQVFAQYNAQQEKLQSFKKVETVTLNLFIKASDDVTVTSVALGFGDGIDPTGDFGPTIADLKEKIRKYFDKNWETINRIPPGAYTAVYGFKDGVFSIIQ